MFDVLCAIYILETIHAQKKSYMVCWISWLMASLIDSVCRQLNYITILSVLSTISLALKVIVQGHFLFRSCVLCTSIWHAGRYAKFLYIWKFLPIYWPACYGKIERWLCFSVIAISRLITSLLSPMLCILRYYAFVCMSCLSFRLSATLRYLCSSVSQSINFIWSMQLCY